MLLNTVFKLKLNFKLEIDLKTETFQNMEEIQKTWKNSLENKLQQVATNFIITLNKCL